MENKKNNLNKGLLPCPFCGGKAEIGGDPHGDRDVHCVGCGVSMFDTCLEGAIEAWNKRVKKTEIDSQ